MAVNDTVLARILIDDQTKLGFNSYARNVERAKKTSQAFRDHAIEKITIGLEKQVNALTKTAKQMDMLAAATYGANDAQIEKIGSLHDAIAAHNAAELAAEDQRKAEEALALAQKKTEDITEKAIQNLRFQAEAADKDADEIEILRLRLMGLSEEQLDLVRDTQLATKAQREQGKSAGAAHGQLRLMRGGLGQLGHQVQDVAVQLQMGQNALLVFGQQGSQVASLFGQNGALIGALLAVGAAVGTALAPELFKTKDNFEKLSEAAEQAAKILTIDFLTGTALLTDEMAELAKETGDLAESKIRLALLAAFEAATAAQDEYAETIKKLVPAVAAVGDTMGVQTDKVTTLSSHLGINREQAEELDAAYVDLINGVEGADQKFAQMVQSLARAQPLNENMNKTLVENEANLQRVTHERNRLNTSIERLTALLNGEVIQSESAAEADKEAADAKSDLDKSYDQLISSLQEEIILLTAGAEAAQRYELAQKGFSEEQINAAISMQQSIDALNKVKKDQEIADEKKKKADEEADRLAKQYADSVTQLIDALHLEIVALDQGADAAYRLSLQQQGLAEGDIAAAMALRARANELRAANEQAEQAADADQDLIDKKKAFSDAVLEQAANLGKSSLEMLMAEAAALGLTESLQAAFDKIQQFQDEQEVLRDQSRIDSNVESIRQSLMTEEELLIQSHQKRLADLEEAANTEMLVRSEYHDLVLKAEADFAKKMSEITKKKNKEEILQGSELTGSMLEQLGKQFSGVKAVNKKMFAAQKAYKIASAIQNTYTAANEALASPYPWPLPQIFAATAIAAGLANVAAIKSSSFEGGGFTGYGARSGGMDGKGGFPAILHPNETVVDHTKGQGQGITIINNIDASGGGADVDMKIREAMIETSQHTIATIQDLMRRKRFA